MLIIKLQALRGLYDGELQALCGRLHFCCGQEIRIFLHGEFFSAEMFFS